MALSMIVEMTSLTPRVTLRIAAMPAHIAPTSIAVTTINRMCSGLGSSTDPPTTAAVKAARRYCPSTPMLNRFMRKPMATASADR
jgi:hypothetical protein